ncbi:hypothetical protein [Haladaptatus sp. R4]|uniref:hypothetical protein n=1 Tax=Haladaptatus sp. R4 TaxID=1679489 RepID=UPI000825BCA9|nr:hypothetical protein [Haladaptatus sp. R4]
MDWASRLSSATEKDLTRRQLLSLLGGGGVVVGGGKAVDNVFIGYGVLVGTNLHDQDLEKLARARLNSSPFDTTISGTRIRLTDDAVRVSNGNDQRTVPLSTSSDVATKADADLEIDGHPVENLVTDLKDVKAGSFEFEFMDFEPFFDRVRTGENHPFTVEALRGNRFSQVSPSAIEEFSGASPKRPKSVLEGLVSGFRKHTYYDIPRYVAGSVEDNVLFGTVDLRQYFKSPITYEALESGENAGMFCYEFTWRSIEALHSVPAYQQRVPVMGAMVYDDRHKHVYTGVASVVRRNGKLVIPMTFVDYTHSTLYDDLHLRWLLGRGMRAYDDRHRATEIRWQP